jgi:mono/diheme cytochrome c family protein
MRTAATLLLLAALLTGPARAGPLDGYTGRQLYDRLCASCHGRGGFGDGPVAPSLKVVVPDLTRMYQRNNGSFPTERVRKIVDGREIVVPHGTRVMPVWGQVLAAEEESGGVSDSQQADEEADKLVERLVDYIRSIQQ